MENEKKRINVDDLPKAEEELTDEEAKRVQGGLTKVGPGTLEFKNRTTSNAVGGSLSSDADNQSLKQSDG